jgi:hypothetical protein
MQLEGVKRVRLTRHCPLAHRLMYDLNEWQRKREREAIRTQTASDDHPEKRIGEAERESREGDTDNTRKDDGSAANDVWSVL